MLGQDLESLARARHEHGRGVEPPDRATCSVGRVVSASAHDGGRVNVNVLELQGAAAREHDIRKEVAQLLLEWGEAKQRRHVVHPLR